MARDGRRKLSRSAEDYLEAILKIERKERVVRLKHISRSLGVSAASVNTALKALARRRLVKHEKYGHVELTETGREQAEKVANRHRIITRFLRDILKVNPDTSSRDACMIEHAVSPETIGRLSVFTEFIESCRNGKPDPNNFFYALRRSNKKE